MYKKSKRFLAGFLAFLLVVTMLPTDMLSVVYAEEDEKIESQALEDPAEDAALEDVEEDDDADAAAEDTTVPEDTKADDVNKDLEEETFTADAEEVTEEEDETIETVIEKKEITEEKVEKVTDNKAAGTYIFDASKTDIAKLDKETKDTIAEGTEYVDGYFKVVDGAAKRGNADTPISLEVKTGAASALQFTIEGKAKVTIVATSTSNNNTSELELRKVGGSAVAEDNGTTNVVGTSPYTTLKFSNVGAGTYKIVSSGTDANKTNRAVRIVSVTVEEEEDRGPAVNLNDATVTLSVNKQELNKAEDGAWTAEYTGKEIKPDVSVTAQVNGTKTEITDYCTVTFGETPDFTNVGAVNVTVKPKTDTNVTGETTVVFKITKATLTTKDYSRIVNASIYEDNNPDLLTGQVNLADCITSLSDDDNFTYTLNTESSDCVKGNVVAVNGGELVASIKDDGTLVYTLAETKPDLAVATVLVIDITSDNYKDAQIKATIDIQTKTEIAVTLKNATHTYNKSAYGLKEKAEISVDGLDNTAIANLKKELSYSYTVEGETEALKDEPIDAGTYDVTATLPESSIYMLSGTVTATLTIDPKPIKLKAKDRSWTKFTGTSENMQPVPAAKDEAAAGDYEFVAVDGEENVGLETGDSMTALKLKYYKEYTDENETEMTDADWADLRNNETVAIVLSDADAGKNYNIVECVNGTLTASVKDVDTRMTTIPEEGASLVASALTGGVINRNILVADNYFLITAASGKEMTVGLDEPEASEESLQLKTGGGGNQFSRSIGFRIDKAANITIDVETGSLTNDARPVVISKLNDNNTVTRCYVENVATRDTIETTLNEAGVYFIYSGNSGIDFYEITVEYVGSSDDDPDEVTIDASFRKGITLPSGADVYFVAGDKKIAASSATALTVGTEYTLKVLDADKTEVEGFFATIDDSSTYQPEADDTDVTITISTTLTITFMNGNEKIFEDEAEMSDLKEGVLYELAPVGSRVNVPEGKEFLGWDLSSDAKATVYYPAGYIHFHENVTLYAVIADIDAITYTVTFEDQYGDEIDATFVLEGGTITFDETYNEYENYVFAGWKLKGDKDPNKVYAVGETYTVTGDVTFVETWKLREYTVTLTDENGNVTKTEMVEAGKEFTFPKTAPAKEGYTFAGWESEEDGSVYGTGGKCVITEDVTFTETWAQPNKEDFTVTFMDRNDNEITKLTKTVKAGDDPVITLPKPLTERIGYVFEGWYDDWNWNCHKPGTTYTVTRNVVFYESWEEEYHETGMYIRLDDEKAYYQGGAAVTPPVEFYYNGESLTPGTDYTVKYKDNKNAGPATLTVTGKNNFAGVKKEKNFMIRQVDIGDTSWTDYATAMTVIKDAKVNPVIIYNGKQLKLGKDFTISGAGLENGKYTAVTGKDEYGNPKPNILKVTGNNNFTGTFDIDVTVVEKNGAPRLAVEIDKNFKPVYGDNFDGRTLFGVIETVDGQQVLKTPGKITVYEKGDSNKKPLVENTDFQVVTVSGGIHSAGTYKFMIVGIGKYTGTVSKSLKISPKPIPEGDIQVGVYDWYNDVLKTTDLTAEYSSTGSVLYGLRVRYKTGENAGAPPYRDMDSRNYKVSYSNNKKVGIGKVKITFINDYKGTKPKTVDFTITGASLNNTNAIAPDMVYSRAGKAYVSKPLVEYNGAILKASEYSVSYAWATETQCKDENGNRKADEDIHWTPAEGNRVNIRLEDEEQYARVKVMITRSARSNFILTDQNIPKTTYYYVRKADPEKAYDLSKAKVEFFEDANCSPDKQYKKIPYCGEELYTPEGNKVSEEYGIGAVFVKVTVKVGRENKIVDPNLYDVTWLNATNKGKATVVIVGKGPDYVDKENKFAVGSKTTSATIDSIGQWIDPPENSNARFGNFLKNIFGK